MSLLQKLDIKNPVISKTLEDTHAPSLIKPLKL